MAVRFVGDPEVVGLDRGKALPGIVFGEGSEGHCCWCCVVAFNVYMVRRGIS
jgi:hypothetical protein